jgi:hypothetical protein
MAVADTGTEIGADTAIAVATAAGFALGTVAADIATMAVRHVDITAADTAVVVSAAVTAGALPADTVAAG